MTITLDLGLSDEAFEELCRKHRDYRLERSSKGELQIMPPCGSDSSDRNSDLNYFLRAWWRKARTGRCFDSSGGFRLPNGAIRSPDAAWVSSERWNALSEEEKRKFAPVCPDFVVELASPSDHLPDLRAKLREYLENGARLGWLLIPDEGRVEIYRPGQDPEVLQNPVRLGGEGVLPGLTVELDGIL